MSTPAARLYPGEVMHRRLTPVERRFVYRTCSVLVDIDRLDELGARLRLFSHNRPNLFSVHDRDFGPRDGSALRPWIDGVLARHGVDLGGGRVELLCFPRLLGYAFNPLAVWYCHHADGALRAVLCEVNNTFGEHHGYLLHGGGEALEWPVRARRAKVFHVSPFLAVEGEYAFRLGRPGRRLGVAIHARQGGRPVLVAVQTGRAAPMTDASLLRGFARTPLLGLKIVTMIHWQALLLWLRQVPWWRKPPPPAEEIS